MATICFNFYLPFKSCSNFWLCQVFRGVKYVCETIAYFSGVCNTMYVFSFRIKQDYIQQESNFPGISLKFCVSDVGLEALLKCQRLRKISMNKNFNHSANHYAYGGRLPIKYYQIGRCLSIICRFAWWVLQNRLPLFSQFYVICGAIFWNISTLQLQ